MRIKLWARMFHLVLALLAAVPLLVLAVMGMLLMFPKTTRQVATGKSRCSSPCGPLLPPSCLLAAAEAALSRRRTKPRRAVTVRSKAENESLNQFVKRQAWKSSDKGKVNKPNQPCQGG